MAKARFYSSPENNDLIGVDENGRHEVLVVVGANWKMLKNRLHVEYYTKQVAKQLTDLFESDPDAASELAETFESVIRGARAADNFLQVGDFEPLGLIPSR